MLGGPRGAPAGNQSGRPASKDGGSRLSAGRVTAREAAGQAASPSFALALLQKQPDAMMAASRQCDGAREAVRAMAADTVEPPVFQPIDGVDCRMRTPRGREGFLRLPFAVGSPLCRQYVEVEQRSSLIRLSGRKPRSKLSSGYSAWARSPSAPPRRVLEDLVVQDELMLVFDKSYRNPEFTGVPPCPWKPSEYAPRRPRTPSPREQSPRPAGVGARPGRAGAGHARG